MGTGTVGTGIGDQVEEDQVEMTDPASGMEKMMVMQEQRVV